MQNYTAILTGKNILSSIKNSLIVSSVTTMYVIVVSTLAAYAISRFHFKGKNLLLGLILVVSMGYKTLRLETRIVNAKAISFYERNGYRKIPNYGKYAGRANSICFEKNLLF